MKPRLASEVVADRRRRTFAERLVERASAQLAGVDKPASEAATASDLAVSNPAASDRAGGANRRVFLSRAAVVGSALAVAPWRYILRPDTAYASVCGPASECADGWTVFCCTVNGGRNACPPGSIAAGWWKNDTTQFCAGGPRYIVDCNAVCSGGCDGRGFCGPSSYSCRCRCHNDPGTCDRRRHCCNVFRYGQCHQELACVGPVVCRVATCIPPWEWDPTCTTTSATSNPTNAHSAPCLDANPYARPATHPFGVAEDQGQSPSFLLVGMESTPSGDGYWLLSSDGRLRAFGDARHRGDVRDVSIPSRVRDLACTPTGLGYWILARDGRVFPFGDAPDLGGIAASRLPSAATAIARTPSGAGYWIATASGHVYPRGDAVHHGGLGRVQLASPVIGIAVNRLGDGYWLLQADGIVTEFGAARHFGNARFRSRAPFVAIAGAKHGKGYWLLRTDGRIFARGQVRHYGDLYGDPEVRGRAYDIERVEAGAGYWILTDH